MKDVYTPGVLMISFSIFMLLSVNIVLGKYMFWQFLLIDKKDPFQYQMVWFLPFDIQVTLYFVVYQSLFILSFVSLTQTQFTQPGYVDRKKVGILQSPPTLQNIEKYYNLVKSRSKHGEKQIQNMKQYLKESEMDVFPADKIKHCQKCLSQNCTDFLQKKQNKKEGEISDLQSLELKFWKPPRAHHCRVCKQCVLGMDHHCLWVNNCVGINNFKFFVLFNFYTCLYSFFSLLSLLCTLYLQSEENNDEGRIIVILYCFAAAFFTFFTFCFFSDLLEGVEKNQTEVQKEKKLLGKPLSMVESMEKCFGIQKITLAFPDLVEEKHELFRVAIHTRRNQCITQQIFGSLFRRQIQ